MKGNKIKEFKNNVLLFGLGLIVVGALLVIFNCFFGDEKMSNENDRIRDTVNNVMTYVDSQEWEKLENTFADSVYIDYSSFNGQDAETLTGNEIVTRWTGFLPAFDLTQHKLSNIEISQESNVVKVKADVRAIHIIENTKGGDTWIVDGSYDFELVKVGNEYKVSLLRLNYDKTLGNLDLPNVAVEKMKSLEKIEKVTFESKGIELVGNIYKPSNYESGKEYKAVVVSGSWTTVKEQMAGLYAQKLADEGFITLAFDFRGYGESEGEPRFVEDPKMKIQDINNAVEYLKSRDDVSEIGALGICAGAGYTLVASSKNQDIKAVVTIASWIHDEEAVKLFYGGEKGVQKRVNDARIARKKYEETGRVEYIKTISLEDPDAAMFGNFDYYLNKARGAIPEWSSDKFAVMSWDKWLEFNPRLSALNLDKPTLMIHSDGAVLPEYTKKYYENIKTKDKKLVWINTNMDSPFHQFNFYDQDKEVNQSVENARDWFDSKLN